MLIDVIKKGSAIRFTLPPHTKKYNYCFLSMAKNPARVSFVKILNYKTNCQSINKTLAGFDNSNLFFYTRLFLMLPGLKLLRRLQQMQ